MPNPERVLSPGMFANVSVKVGDKKRYLTLPQTAVIYNPYGETVYVVTHQRRFDKAQARRRRDDTAPTAGRRPRNRKPDKARRSPATNWWCSSAS